MKINFVRLSIVYLKIAIACLLLTVAPCVHATTVTLKVLHSFTGGSDGRNPESGLITDKSGNLYGLTGSGGNGGACGTTGCGTAFELSAPKNGSSQWTETILYQFTGGSDGVGPIGSLVMDNSGNLYGVADGGGVLNGSSCVTTGGVPYGCGVVFELSPPSAPGGQWTETTIYSFLGPEGATPEAGLVFDNAGNLYGTTVGGGDPTGLCADNQVIGCGVVFELSPPSQQGGAWAFADLYEFTGGSDGGLPMANLIFDNTGDLYGTTCSAGTSGGGVVFELMPPGILGNPWTDMVLANLPFGSCPRAPVVFDATGNLYGTTFQSGTVFELSPTGGGVWTLTTLYGLIDPYAGLTLDSSGNLYGTNIGKICGSVFRLQKQANWKAAAYNFFNVNGEPCSPQAPVIFGKGNALYGTSVIGGTAKLGTVFAILP